MQDIMFVFNALLKPASGTNIIHSTEGCCSVCTECNNSWTSLLKIVYFFSFSSMFSLVLLYDKVLSSFPLVDYSCQDVIPCTLVLLCWRYNQQVPVYQTAWRYISDHNFCVSSNQNLFSYTLGLLHSDFSLEIFFRFPKA